MDRPFICLWWFHVILREIECGNTSRYRSGNFMVSRWYTKQHITFFFFFVSLNIAGYFFNTFPGNSLVSQCFNNLHFSSFFLVFALNVTSTWWPAEGKLDRNQLEMKWHDQQIALKLNVRIWFRTFQNSLKIIIRIWRNNSFEVV